MLEKTMIRNAVIGFITVIVVIALALGALALFTDISPSDFLPGSSKAINQPLPSDGPEVDLLDSDHENETLMADALVEAEPEPEPKNMILAATGDIMAHLSQIESARILVDGREDYNFDHSFVDIKPYFDRADFLIGNIETTIAGKENRGYSGYPEFNAPEGLLASLKKAGYDMITTAGNHVLDRREAGLLTTLDNLDKHDLLHTGTFRSQEERDAIEIIEVNDIKLAVLSYTYGTNGIPIPEGKGYLVNLLDPDLMLADVAKVRDQVDFVIVAMHAGHEYHRQPNEEQTYLAQLLTDNGVDIILGNHPHVIQPGAWLGDSFVIYSMGNIVSNQPFPYTYQGMVLYLHLQVNPDGERLITKAEFLPTHVHMVYDENGKYLHRILPAPEAIANYEAGLDPYLRPDSYASLVDTLETTVDHLTIEADINDQESQLDRSFLLTDFLPDR